MFTSMKSKYGIALAAMRAPVLRQFGTSTSSTTIPNCRHRTLEKIQFVSFDCNNLWDNNGARKPAKILGRGPGSGRGKTSGRGHKGRTARQAGTVAPWFEGGQTPMSKRLPKIKGRPRKNKLRLKPVPVDRLMYFIQKGRLDTSKTITIRDMFEAGVVGKVKAGVKLLSFNPEKIDRPLHFEVSDASAEAISAIKAKGGSVTIKYRTPLTMRYHLMPYKFMNPIADPMPPIKRAKKMVEIGKMGAELDFKMPTWLAGELERKAALENEIPEEDEFVIPAPRYPGVGKDTIRKRRPQLTRKYQIVNPYKRK